ncbi:MAG: indole acetimide hydrolase [Deltaproteobacteria bacterium]|nr:indole acetimide hydrolase [Deltaproteobacteria bacterium]
MRGSHDHQGKHRFGRISDHLRYPHDEGGPPSKGCPPCGAAQKGRGHTDRQNQHPRFRFKTHTGNRLWGKTLNPWDPSRTPGGSSGGDAVAVATGMVPLGIGNDYGGSLRCPAQFCGTATVRPTLGRVPDHISLMPAEPAITLQLFMVQGPITRQVRDLKAVLKEMSGPDARDPRWVPAPLQGPTLPRPIGIAVTTDPGGQGTDPAIADKVRKAARLLMDASYRVEEVEPSSVMEAMNRWLEATGAELQALMGPEIESYMSPDALKFLKYWIEVFPENNLMAYMQSLAERNRIAREWAQFQEHHPLLLGPVNTIQPFKVGYDILSRESFQEVILSFRLNMTVNLLGLPSVVVPVGLVDGLPQAVQIIGPRFREDLCLGAAELIEGSIGSLTPIDPK